MKIERSSEPKDYLGDLANEMLERLDELDLDVKAVVILEKDERCMTALHGFESDIEAIAVMVAHLKAVFEANGKTFLIAPLRRG